ncbi:MAG: transporter [Pseudomonadota bacterium]|nr:transporter [Pseudomonadota bacterium]
MHQMMLDLMVKMMPFMMPLVYAGGALLAIAVVALVAQIASGRGGGLATACGWLLVILGVFFLACQAAGMFLGAAPSINFADSTKGDFDLKPFWEIGLGMLVPGIVIAAVAKMARRE